MTLSEVAALVGAQLSPDADPNLLITGASSLQDAQPGEISFFEHPKYLGAARATRAAAMLVPMTFAEPHAAALLRVENPSAAFSRLLDFMAPPVPERPVGIHPSAFVHPGAKVDPTSAVLASAVVEEGAQIGARTVIGPNATIERDCRIGDDCFIASNAVLREKTILGARVTIHSGTVIGSDGFGFRLAKGRHEKVIHRGHVQIDDDVEIGSCTTVDRARFGRTWIQQGTKIDNLVQIAHNVIIGPHCLIVAQTGISGSTRLGKYVTLAGPVGVVGHTEIGDEVLVYAKSGVIKDAAPKQQLMGTYSVPAKEARTLEAHYRRLPDTAMKIKALEREVTELKALVSQLVHEKSSKPATEG